MKCKTLIYVYPYRSSFVSKDVDIYKTNYQVIEYLFKVKPKYRVPLEFLKQLLFLIKHTHRSSVLVVMFAGYHSFLPLLIGKIMRKPTVLMPGGTDCVKYPVIGYGNYTRILLSTFTKWSFSLAKYIVPVSESLRLYTNNYSDLGDINQGYNAFCKKIKSPTIVINNGYDSHLWYKNEEKDPLMALTVALNIGVERNTILKGVDLIISIAPLFPQYKFYLIGCTHDFIKNNTIENIVPIPPLGKNELQHYYSKATYYFQLSISEGFPNALCEAMLCECIPIVSNISSMPEIVCDTGYVIEKRDAVLLSQKFKTIQEQKDLNKGRQARSRIEAVYTYDKRAQELLQLLAKIAKH